MSLGNIFNKISTMLGTILHDGEPNIDGSANDKHTEDTAMVAEEKVESKDQLINSVLSTLTAVIDEPDSISGKQLVIWLECDQLQLNNYANDAYCLRLLSALRNERNLNFGQVTFRMGLPDSDLHATMIGSNEKEYLQVLDMATVTNNKNCVAVISIFGSAGSLLQSEYKISSDDMKERKLSAYNIGVGRFPQLPSGYRENHIAIDDDPNSPMADRNKYVSRKHAHIGFSEKIGFYLQVEIDGTRLMGKRTRIFRGEEKIECDNPSVKCQLQDGDLIELGKAVVLKFELNA